MLKRKRFGSRSKRYRRQAPTVLVWTFGVIAGIGVIVAVAYLYGNPASKDEDFFTSLHETFRRPAVAAVGAFAGAVWIAWCLRQIIFEVQAWRPGRIIVEELKPAENAKDADVQRLTAAFRDRLARSHLQSPAAVPALAPQGDFLDVLASTPMDPTQPLSILTGLLRASRPTHAYQVRGSLSKRAGRAKPYGVTIHLERLPGRADPGVTLWDTDWDRAVARAADHASASILPRTRRCSSPWTAWRGYHLPAGLLNLYERAVELEEERRYDEALDCYFCALRRDPMNLALRLQIGYLQEKLALFMDALDTYGGILAVARPGREGHGRAASVNGDDGRHHHAPELALTKPDRSDLQRRYYRRAERRNREEILIAARYRHAILLGGTELPRQWCKESNDSPKREAERHTLRKRLAPSLALTFGQALMSKHVEWVTRPVYLPRDRKDRPPKPPRTGRLRKPLIQRVRDPLAGRPDVVEPLHDTDPASVLREAQDREALEELCVFASIHELVDLRRRLPRLRRARKLPLSRAMVDLSGLCLVERLKHVQAAMNGGEPSRPDPVALRRSVRQIEGWRAFRRYQEHYNAACALSLPLLTEGRVLASPEANLLVTSAVSRLERAVSCADSGFVATRRDWLLSDDPDLDGLRTKEDFKHFEATYFPSATDTCKRPPEQHTWEMSRYTLDLLAATSDGFAEAWRNRKSHLELEIEVRSLADWCEQEMSAWELMRDVTGNHRHWQTRVRLIDFARGLGTGSHFVAPTVAFPRFAEHHAPPALEIGDWVDCNDSRLAELSSMIDEGREKADETPLIADLALTRVALGKVDGTGTTLERATVAELCEAHATVWGSFGKCVTDHNEDPDEVLKAIEGLIKRWATIKDGFSASRAGAERDEAESGDYAVAPLEAVPARVATRRPTDSTTTGARAFVRSVSGQARRGLVALGHFRASATGNGGMRREARRAGQR
jgi:tetratricopeptide (TPR) repeat protein